MKAFVLAALVVLSGCNSAPPGAAPIPTDGIHFTGAADITYSTVSGGVCTQNLGVNGWRFMGFSGVAPIGEPTMDMVVIPYSGPGKYEIQSLTSTGTWLWVAIRGSRQWRAGSGEIVVTSEDGKVATGTVRAKGLVEINTGTKVDVAGTWTCTVQIAPPLAPSPPPTPIVVPSPSPLPVGTPVARQVLAPAKVLPVVDLCSNPISQTANGNAWPVFCRSGAINVLAWRFYASIGTHVLVLGRTATSQAVHAAMCQDGALNHATYEEEDRVYALAAAYYGWAFAPAPNPADVSASPVTFNSRWR